MFRGYSFGCCKVDGSAEALKLVLAIYQDEFFILISDANPTYILLIFVFFFYATTGSYHVCGYGRVYGPDAGK
jgi:hypothetical protein